MRLKITPHTTSTKEPRNTGDKIKYKFALVITPRRATAPEGGWRQRNNCPKAIAIATAIPQEKELLPKQLIAKIAEVAPNILPIIKFLGWAKGLSSTAKRSTVEAPKGAINNDWSLCMHITDKIFIAINAPKNDIKIFPCLNEGCKDLPFLNCFSKLKNIYFIYCLLLKLVD